MFWIHKVIQCSSRHRDHTHTQTYIITRVDKNNGQEQNNFLSHFRPSLTSVDQQTDVDLTANYLTAIISLRGRALCTMQASALWPQTVHIYTLSLVNPISSYCHKLVGSPVSWFAVRSASFPITNSSTSSTTTKTTRWLLTLLATLLVQSIRIRTVNVLHDIWCETVPWQCHQHLSSALTPRHVVCRTPARNGTEQQCQVILTSQLFSRRRSTAQPHQHLHTVSVSY